MTEQTYALLVWLGVMSALTLALFGWDKLMARAHRSRVPEGALLGAAALGGGAGGLLGMLLFRHKLRKPPFPLLLTLFFLAQAGVLIWSVAR